jgi:hypothetical protein
MIRSFGYRVSKEEGIAIFGVNDLAMPTLQSCPAISWFAARRFDNFLDARGVHRKVHP